MLTNFFVLDCHGMVEVLTTITSQESENPRKPCGSLSSGSISQQQWWQQRKWLSWQQKLPDDCHSRRSSNVGGGSGCQQSSSDDAHCYGDDGVTVGSNGAEVSVSVIVIMVTVAPSCPAIMIEGGGMARRPGTQLWPEVSSHWSVHSPYKPWITKPMELRSASSHCTCGCKCNGYHLSY